MSKLTVEALAKADLQTTWDAYSNPDDITQWNTADPSWHSPRSEVDLREGGKFNTRMEARGGSMGFDFEGTYTKVVPNELIEYRMGDGREASVRFSEDAGGTRIRVDFDPESQNPHALQQQGWQAILDNFGRHVAAKA